MTLWEFMAALAAFFVFYMLFVAAVLAKPMWKDEVGIDAVIQQSEADRLDRCA